MSLPCARLYHLWSAEFHCPDCLVVERQYWYDAFDTFGVDLDPICGPCERQMQVLWNEKSMVVLHPQSGIPRCDILPAIELLTVSRGWVFVNISDFRLPAGMPYESDDDADADDDLMTDRDANSPDNPQVGGAPAVSSRHARHIQRSGSMRCDELSGRRRFEQHLHSTFGDIICIDE